MAKTAIEWATHVWNPFTGCDRVSPGCAHCYAATVAGSMKARELGRARKALREGKKQQVMRYQKDGDPKSSGPGFGFTIHWDKLKNPSVPPPGSRVFVNSMSDVFHPDATFNAIVAMFGVFASNPQVDWLVLTKRPERMAELLSDERFMLDASRAASGDTLMPVEWPLPNVWLGTSIENRQFVSRADDLRRAPAAVRFISAEPLLGPLVGPPPIQGIAGTPEDGELPKLDRPLDLTDIDWLIAGGESGPKHRRLDIQWMHDLRDACKREDTAYFVKQLGGNSAGNTLEELPEDLRIRELPRKAVPA